MLSMAWTAVKLDFSVSDSQKARTGVNLDLSVSDSQKARTWVKLDLSVSDSQKFIAQHGKDRGQARSLSLR